ncbi:DUF1345 domain-containing protein [Phenylobacterium sp.]|uniref:DUF1345 domain-containing protein n=1 Tax=Phenylobacterium sp. TaxID=1871053 RepID=UPI00391CC8B4
MIPAPPRFLLFLGLLAAGSVTALAAGVAPTLAFLTGFDIGAVAFAVSMLPAFMKGDAESLRRKAAREDAGRPLAPVISAVVIAAIVLAVVSEAEAARESPVLLTVVLASLALAWTFASLVMAIHYAHLYYDGRAPEGGLLFPGGGAPDFGDFCYFAFTLSATFQVSDVQIAERRLRRLALLHGVGAFLFNIGVVALTVGVAASVLVGR